MKFVCQHCHSKYAISDDRVRNKRLKIRCKKCQNIIEIVGSTALSSEEPASPVSNALASDSSSKGSDASPPRDQFASSFSSGSSFSAERIGFNETELEAWFASIDGAPVGPISARQIDAHRRRGKLGDDSLVWRDGMPDWTPLHVCESLKSLLEQVAGELPAPLRAESGPSGEKITEPERDAPEISTAKEQTKRPPDNIVQEKFFVPDSDEPDITVPVDIEDELASEVNIRSLVPPKTGGNRAYLLASVGFFITAVVTLGVVLFGGGAATGEPQPVRTVEKIVEKVVYRDRIVEPASSNDKGVGESGDLPTDRSGTSRSGRKSRGKKQDNRDAVDNETKALMARLGVVTPTEGAPVGERAARRESTRETASGGTLSSGQMQSVVNRNKSSLKSCYERSLKKGEAPDNRDLKVIFKVTVGGSGTVRKVSLGGEANQLSSLRRCLTRSVDKWVFPSSSGESRLEFPFVFTPTR